MCAASGGERWTNTSVRALAGDEDAVAVIVERARSLLRDALDAGLTGPPVDPFRLAQLMGLHLVARADVGDARIEAGDLPPSPDVAPLESHVGSRTPLVLQYNPTRPRGRLRYSVAHEIAHALFPDVAESARHRTGTGAVPQGPGPDSWQLELLCNLAAAELLMPTQAVEGILDSDPDLDFLMDVRARFDVSTEALLRRLASGTSRPLAVLALSRVRDAPVSPMRLDYAESSAAWAPRVERGVLSPSPAVFSEPTAVGQVARGEASIGDEAVQVQCVGIPPYPGLAWPRVMALVEPADAPRLTLPGLAHRQGDVADVADDLSGPVVIAHVVSDSARAWGRSGVAASLAGRFPDAARAFRAWSISDDENLQLGNVHSVSIAHGRSSVLICSMVVQRGYGPSLEGRLVYSALATALDDVATRAQRGGASVRLPRIGAGQAGGRWDVVEDLIAQRLVRKGVAVTVFTRPGAGARYG